MLAHLLVVSLFLFLCLLGQAVISLFRPRLGVLWSWFAAPTVGLALVVVILTRLNVWGIPVRSAGPWLTAVLALCTAVVLWWRRPVMPWRQLWPFAAIALGYLVYVGWPMMRFGFNWISYGNDDMANYCLAAERFLDHGYYDVPLQSELEGRDYSQHYWFMHALQQIRPGSELTIAWIASLTGLKAHQVFMPAILILSLLQIFALGALGIFRGRFRRMVLLAFLLFATSPLFGLGTLYQLIAQVGGIAILLATASLLFTPRRLTLRKAAIAGLLTACLAIFYPEVTPFVALGVMLCALRLRYGAERERFSGYAGFIVGVAAITFALIATNTYQFINTLVMQSAGSAGLGALAEINDQSGGLVLFPWTLVPSFIPMLFGLHPFGVVGFDPASVANLTGGAVAFVALGYSIWRLRKDRNPGWLAAVLAGIAIILLSQDHTFKESLISVKIFVGFLLLGYLLWRILRGVRDDTPAGYLGAIMAPLGFYLFFKGQDFGLFKLAMFAQPVIILLLCAGVTERLQRPQQRRAVRFALAVFMAATVPAHAYYSYASLGTYGGGLTEVVDASRFGVNFTPPKDLKYEAIESDISNVVTAKMLAQYTQGTDTRFLSRSYMDNIANIAVLKFLRTPDPDLGPQARLVEKLALLRGLLPPEIMNPEVDVPYYNVMTIRKEGANTESANNWTETSSRNLDYSDRLFVSVRSNLDHFNKANPGTGWINEHMFQYKLESQVKDRLVFIHSALSPHYYSSARFKAAFFQREPEPISEGSVYFHGTGRYNHFQIVNPSPNLRVIMDFSRTSLGEGRSRLPAQAVVVGDEDYPLPFVGHGSARVVSPPIKPEYFEKQAYITVDFREDPQPILKDKTGLMALYGRKYNLDDRRLVGFTRDISVITEEQYRALERPTKITLFPGDLYRYPGFEYSGLFEDGWIAEDAYVKLGASHPGQLLYFKGFVPETPEFQTEGVDVTISINQKPTEIVNLKSGEFTITRLIREAVDVTSISLHFSRAVVYEARRDKRAVSAYVHEISIGDIPDLVSLRKLTNPKGDKLELPGVDDDGWLAPETTFTIPAFEGFKVLKVDLEMPGWAQIANNSLIVTVNNEAARTETVTRGSYHSLFFPLTMGQENRVNFRATQSFTLPNESRVRSFLIKNISFENISPTDLFARGWHSSGYRFGIDHADDDGWVDRRIAFNFPATGMFKNAIVTVVRYPARTDLPLGLTVNGTENPGRSLGLEQPEQISVTLSPTRETALELTTPQTFPLAAPDTRARSFRIVSIDFN